MTRSHGLFRFQEGRRWWRGSLPATDPIDRGYLFCIMFMASSAMPVNVGVALSPGACRGVGDERFVGRRDHRVVLRRADYSVE